MSRRCLGLDVHRDFAQVAIWSDGLVVQAGQVALTNEELRIFADSLAPTDEVALEATGNSYAIASLLAPRVGRLVVSNPKKTRAIAEAKVKTDKARRADPRAAAGGRLPARRVGRRRGDAGAPPAGRSASTLVAPAHAEEPGPGDLASKGLMTIPGVDVTIAMSITAVVGDFSRFSSPNKLVRYLGLNPRVKQSRGQPASDGRITKQGRAHARGMLVRRPGSPSRRQARCARCMSASAHAAGCRSPSSRCCAGT
jgi:transposase